jgi:hypothetical protein
MALVRERTIPTERPPPVGEVSANFYKIHNLILINKVISIGIMRPVRTKNKECIPNQTCINH